MEAMHDLLARVPTRMESARTALGIIFSTTVIMIAWIECSGRTACELFRGHGRGNIGR